MAELLGLSAVLGYAVFERGGVYRIDWSICLLALGVLLVVVRPAGSWLMALLLPAYVALQLGISVVPAATLEYFLRVCGYVAVFLLVRHVAKDKPWGTAAPLVAIAALEAILGIAQFYSEPAGSAAHGTYVNRNHFAGLLEMAFPFAVMWPVMVLKGNEDRYQSPAAPAIKACVGWSVAALILVGIVHSLSRMGFVACLGSLVVMGVTATVAPREDARGAKHAKKIAVAAVIAVVGAMFILLPPDQLIERFAGLASTEQITPEARHEIWKETLGLVKAHPWLGSGMGSYESAFLKYKTVAPMFTVDMAHNDYLQSLAELGVVGSGILVLLLVFLVKNLIGLIGDPELRYLGIAGAGALGAILLHSSADFNLYIPANAVVLAWIGGIGSGQCAVGSGQGSRLGFVLRKIKLGIGGWRFGVRAELE